MKNEQQATSNYMFEQFKIIHFVGIGGIGMSGIAEVLKNLGYEVTGSDMKTSSNIERLKDIGIKVYIGHEAANINSAHVVVISSAVQKDNVEVIEANQRAIPIIPRAEMLAEIGRLKYSILVAGSHGKTTTTSLISTILSHAGIDPTVVIGGRLKATNSNAMLGRGEFIVAEADESDGSFLKLNPTIAVATNIDNEHLDYFGSISELKNSFAAFLNKVPFYGQLVICIDDSNIREILPLLNRRYTTYGFSEEADFFALNIKMGFITAEYDLYNRKKLLGKIKIPLSGKHNILNSLSAIIVALSLRIDLHLIQESLNNFEGIKRRFEFKGEFKGIKIFDDYGHHPTEIQMTLKGIRENTGKRIVVVFQPHRYTRVRDLMNDFGVSFSDADRVYILDIYPAGESPVEGINSLKLMKKIKDNGTDVIYVESTEELVNRLREDCRADDIVITLGAGDVWKVGEELLKIADA